jgi:uncharacterized membrane protein
MLRWIVILAFCIIGVLAAVERADASLTACNRTSQVVAIAYFVDDLGIAESKGWWNIAAGRCVTILNDDLSNYDTVGYYAYSNTNTYWAGDSNSGWRLCIDFARAFYYSDAEEACATKRMYRPLSVPRGDSSYTFDLT